MHVKACKQINFLFGGILSSPKCFNPLTIACMIVSIKCVSTVTRAYVASKCVVAYLSAATCSTDTFIDV